MVYGGLKAKLPPILTSIVDGERSASSVGGFSLPCPGERPTLQIEEKNRLAKDLVCAL